MLGGMSIPAEFLPDLVCWASMAGYTYVLCTAGWHAPWWHLRIGEDSNVFFAACIGALGLWLMRTGIAPGLDLHLLGATIFTLMFGWHFAVLGLSAVLLATTWNAAGGGMLAVGVNGLVTVVLPVAVSEYLRRIAERSLPANFFVYIFFSAFFAAGLSILAVGMLSSVVLWWSGAYQWAYVFDHYTVFFFLLGFPEAFLSGGLLSIFVVYRPQWVATFDDRRYLHQK